MKNNITVAHRGAFKKNGLPENSIASLQEAIRIGCKGSEFDVWMTADSVLVVHHDPVIEKVSIEKLTYQELSQFSLSNGEKLPLLEEYLRAGAHQDITLVCEIKPSEISKERSLVVAEKVVEVVKKLKVEKLIYISFDYDILKKILKIDNGAQTQYLQGEKSPLEVKKDGITGVDYHYSVFQKHPQWIAEAKQNHIKLNAWTVNDEKDMDWLITQGLTSKLTSLWPRLLRALSLLSTLKPTTP